VTKSFNFAFITQDDPFYVRIFFEEFFAIYERPGDIKGVVIAPPMGKKSFAALVRQMYEFYGPRDFVRVGARYVLYRVTSKLPVWLRAGKVFSLRQLCEDKHVNVVFARDTNAPGFLQLLARWDLDLIVSVAAPQIFREPLINLPRKGCINIHNSMLPKYRGMLPNFWQMFNGEEAVGTTIHRINAGIDDGDILLQRETPIQSGESLAALIRRTKRVGARFMAEALDQLREDRAMPMPNRREDATYYSFPTRDDVAAFRRRGYRLL